MNEKKIIKDLKERNEKLKIQYDYQNIHLISLEKKQVRLEQENAQLKAQIDEVKIICITNTVKTTLPLYTKETLAKSELANEILSKLEEAGK